MAYYSALPDTLFVNGHDLQLHPGIVVVNFDGLFSPGTGRGENDVVPNRRGQLGVALPLDAYSFSVPIIVLSQYDGLENVLPTDTPVQRRTALVRNVASLARKLNGTGGVVTLTRRLSNATGFVDTTAAGQYVDGLAFELLNVETGRTEVQFVNLDGCWYDVEATDATPGIVAVFGSVTTRRIVLTLPGPGTLTNVTLGVSVTVTSACVLDVWNYKASSDIGTLTSSGDVAWFALAPGEQTVTWSGAGTPTIRWRGAYL